MTGRSAAAAWATAVILLGPAAAEQPSVDARPPVVEDLAPTGPSVAERLDRIRAQVQAVAVYPPIARARSVSGEVQVRFTITADGTPTGIEIARSSGSTALDRAAERAVADASPLPYVYGNVTVPVRFALRD